MMRESAENPNQNGVSNQIKTFLLVSLKRQQIYLIHILRPQTGRQLILKRTYNERYVSKYRRIR
jgi:hypothetical protein